MLFKKIYLYDMEDNLLREFKTTEEFAEYSGHDREYIYHNLKYCKKIRIKGNWYKIRRNDGKSNN